MTNIQERLLENKMTEIEQARSWSPRVISKFETLIRSGDDLSLYRINPLAFARDRAIAESESIDLFLHATRSGLFDMSWDVVCPQSGMVLDSFGALRTLKTHYVCGLCDVTGDTDLDDFIEVTFTVSPQLRRLPFHDPGSLSVEDFHWKLRFLERRADAGPTGAISRRSAWTGARAFILCRQAPPPRCARTSVPAHCQASMSRRRPHLRYRSRASRPRRQRICGLAMTGSASLQSLSAVPPGPIVIEVENTGAARGSLLLINWPPEILALTVKPALDFDPYMSGGMLLADRPSGACSGPNASTRRKGSESGR